MYRALPFLLILFLCACRPSNKENALFAKMDNTGIDFSNNITNSPEFNIFSYRNFYNGGGVAIGDLNNDGLADVFFTANMGSNKLYLNKGNWIFDDISEKAGLRDKKDWSTGVVLVDINFDGWLDIFVCNAGYIEGREPRCQLFINNHDLTFTEKAEEYGLTNKGGYTTHAAFFDYDMDGDLDCFIINNSFIPVNTLNYANKRALRAPDWPVADFLKGGGDHLLRNDNGKFIDVSKEAGIYGSLISFGLGVTVGDVNGDHYPDIYVSNDFFERDYLYINQRNGKFIDQLEDHMQHISHSSMGADMADINNDGYPDIFTTDMLPDDDYRLKTTTSFDNIDVYRLKQRSGFYNQFTQNTLQVNNKSGKFFETGFYSGVAASDWSWGGLIFDADNDGLSDIFVCNGIYNDVTNQDFIDFFANDVIQQMVLTGKKEQFDEVIGKMPSKPIPNKFYKNKGQLQFAESAAISGLGQPSFSNGSAYGDLDNDGDLDLIVNNVNEKAFVYQNNANEQKNNYISVLLKGKTPNSFAVGSKITIYQGNQLINRELIPTRGFQSSVDYRQVIGLGKGGADSLKIIWPDQSETLVLKPQLNKPIEIVQMAGIPRVHSTDSAVVMLKTVDNSVFEKQVEDDYIDFYTERNIPIMLSREGPHADTADVNGDGLTDIFIGAPAKQAGQLYLQTKTGYKKSTLAVFEADKDFEDVAVLFFDADKDGDKDLFIGAGGNVQPKQSRLLHHRLYINDGKGNFQRKENSLPESSVNVAVAVSNDIDRDGDEDLFVGSRSVPQDYGRMPESYVYINDGTGIFKGSTRIQAGMITDAFFANVTGDNKKELIITGEWMHPKIFSVNISGALEEINTNLMGLKGWWQSVNVADLDADGDNDLVLGNIGLNCYLQPKKESPVKLWISDFDQNGTQDKIITRSVNKKDVPVFLKRELTEQLPSLKKQNLRFEDYAVKSITELFSAEMIKKATVSEFTEGASIIAINKGNGQFEIKQLPVEVELSSVNAISCIDINQDGKKDIIMGGNLFYFQPQLGRLDASFGHVLINKGNNNFEWTSPAKSGLGIRGQIKDIIPMIGNRKELIVLQNDEKPVLYQFQ